MAEERVTCAKLAVKYDLPQWVIYQIAHRMRFGIQLSHYDAAINAIQAKCWHPYETTDFFDEFDVYKIPAVPRHA